MACFILKKKMFHWVCNRIECRNWSYVVNIVLHACCKEHICAHTHIHVLKKTKEQFLSYNLTVNQSEENMNTKKNISIYTNIIYSIYVGTTPHTVTVTTRIITFLIGNPYKPSFVTVTGWGVDRIYTYVYCIYIYILSSNCFRAPQGTFFGLLLCTKYLTPL